MPRPNDYPRIVPFQTETFDLMRLVEQCLIRRDLLAGLDGARANLVVKFVEDRLGDMLLQLQTRLLCKKWTQEENAEYVPADWWQAVRQRWLPGWWLRRHPVRHRRIVITRHVYHVCPHLGIVAQPDAQQLHFNWMKAPPLPPHLDDMNG